MTVKTDRNGFTQFPKAPKSTKVRHRISNCAHAYEEDRLDLRRKKVYFRCINCGVSYVDTLYPGAELQLESSSSPLGSRGVKPR